MLREPVAPAVQAGSAATWQAPAGRRPWLASAASSPLLRWLLLAALATTAVVLDGGSPRAWAYLERCASADSVAALLAMALRLDTHLLAFPATALAMLAMCLLAPQGGSRAGWGGLALRAGLMLASMAPVCVLAWWLASGMPAGVQAHVFAGTMLALPPLTARMSRHLRIGCARMVGQGLP